MDSVFELRWKGVLQKLIPITLLQPALCTEFRNSTASGTPPRLLMTTAIYASAGYDTCCTAVAYMSQVSKYLVPSSKAFASY
jgi:hypothetical protein